MGIRIFSSISFLYWEQFIFNAFLHSNLLLKIRLFGVYNTIFEKLDLWKDKIHLPIKYKNRNCPCGLNKETSDLGNLEAYLKWI